MSDPVRIEVTVEWNNGRGMDSDIVEVARAKWEAMTPKKRQQHAEEHAKEHLENVISYGYTILGADAGSDEEQA